MTTGCDDSALDLSTPTSLTPDLIVLPASAITLSTSNNIPFHITASGHLVLANFMVERVNEGLVFKQLPSITEQTETVSSNTLRHEQNPVEPEESADEEENSQQMLLGQKVCSLLKKAATESSEGNDVVLDGHNLTALASFADRLKNFRLCRQWSQAKLSNKLLISNLPLNHQLVFSQSFLCRFEKMQVTLRAALGAHPHLKRWLDQMEKEEAPPVTEGEQEADEDQLQSLVDHAYGDSDKDVFQIPVELLDLRDPVNRNCSTTDNQFYFYADDHPREDRPSLHREKGEGRNPQPEEQEEELQSRRRGKKRCDSLHVPPPPPPEPHLEPRRRRKKRIFFDEETVRRLMEFYSHTPKPSGEQYTQLSTELNYPRESIRVWFCNRRFLKHK